MHRRRLLTGAFAASLTASPALAAPARAGPFLFVYFKGRDNGAAGVRYALSGDGWSYEALNGGRPVLAPQTGKDAIMRDPCIAWDPRQNRYHMVWTSSWTSDSIGYACSDDLIHWSPQRILPVMRAFAGTRNAWAPELFYDARAQAFVIFWSSTVPGVSDAQGVSEDGYNHRIYATSTRDFQSFSPTRLLFDPGFSVIDATFLRRGDQLYLIFKDERVRPERKLLMYAPAGGPLGPFGPVSAPFSPAWVEGPTALDLGGEAVVFYDNYTHNAYGAVASRDLRVWRDVSDRIHMPDGASHGAILPLPAAHARSLRARFANDALAK